MNWSGLESAAPELARLGRERLELKRPVLLGTLRKDGSPRISPVEAYLAEGHLLIGSMASSAKTRDLLRDPRCALHSAVVDPDGGEGELQVYGRVAEAAEDVRNSCRAGWWQSSPPGAARVFSLEIEQATFIEWDIAGGEMTVRRWSEARGYSETKRSYP
jgi:hypothetical protein